MRPIKGCAQFFIYMLAWLVGVISTYEPHPPRRGLDPGLFGGV